LKEVCAALLESDVNVKLVSQLRQKVRTKVKAAFESGGERAKEANRKNVVQKVSNDYTSLAPSFPSNHLFMQAIFDELVNLVDPGIEPYKPKKGYPNVVMAVGLQACRTLLLVVHPYPVLGKWQNHHVYQVSCTLSEAWIQSLDCLR
jgi:signal recognition particle subunit SRP54